MEGSGTGLKVCHVFADSFFFLKKRTIVHFAKKRGVGVTKLVIFWGRHKCMTPKAILK